MQSGRKRMLNRKNIEEFKRQTLEQAKKVSRNMFQKFIINQDGVLKFGHVYLHRDLLGYEEQCPYGGGLWKTDEMRGAILLYGRSFDFGTPDFNHVHRIEWTGVGGKPATLFYLPNWPDENPAIPVYAK